MCELVPSELCVALVELGFHKEDMLGTVAAGVSASTLEAEAVR